MKLLYLLLSLLFFGISNCYAEENSDTIAQGKTKSAVCAACHGAKGIATIDIYPNLAGQNYGYLVNSIKAYRDGKRKGGLSAVMTPMAANLSDDDINNLAAYYNSLSN